MEDAPISKTSFWRDFLLFVGFAVVIFLILGTVTWPVNDIIARIAHSVGYSIVPVCLAIILFIVPTYFVDRRWSRIVFCVGVLWIAYWFYG